MLRDHFWECLLGQAFDGEEIGTVELLVRVFSSYFMG